MLRFQNLDEATLYCGSALKNVGSVNVPKKRRIINRHEQEIQKAIVRWLKLVRVDAVWFHIPNGGARNRTEAAILSGMGVKSGIPDLEFHWVKENGSPSTGYIEVKEGNCKLSKNQRIVADSLLQIGIPVEVVNDVRQVAVILRKWGVRFNDS